MGHNSYHKKEYRDLQSRITKENWRKGVFDYIYKKDKRVCARKGCGLYKKYFKYSGIEEIRLISCQKNLSAKTIDRSLFWSKIKI